MQACLNTVPFQLSPSFTGDFAHPKKLLQQPLMLILKSKFRLLNLEEMVHRGGSTRV